MSEVKKQGNTLKCKKAISDMKYADSSRGSANSDPSKGFVFRYMSLLKALKSISKSLGLEAPESKRAKLAEEPGRKLQSGQIHWSRDAVVLVGTALEKRLREVLAAAQNVVSYSKKQTVTERALIFAASIGKDSVSVFKVPKEEEENIPKKRKSPQQDSDQDPVSRVVNPAAIGRIAKQVGILRMSQKSIVDSLRQASRFFLRNIVSDVCDMVRLDPKSTVSPKMILIALGSWGVSLAGFVHTGKKSTSPSKQKEPQSDLQLQAQAEPVPTSIVQSTPAPVEQVQSTPAPVEQVQSTPAPVEQVQFTPAPVEQVQIVPQAANPPDILPTISELPTQGDQSSALVQ